MTWLLYAVGLVLSLLLVMMSIPPLAFAIGMYLPLADQHAALHRRA